MPFVALLTTISIIPAEHFIGESGGGHRSEGCTQYMGRLACAEFLPAHGFWGLSHMTAADKAMFLMLAGGIFLQVLMQLNMANQEAQQEFIVRAQAAT